MATWHQRKNTAGLRALWAPTTDGTWKVISDTWNQPASCMSGFTSFDEAQTYVNNCRMHRPNEAQYIIGPEGMCG